MSSILNKTLKTISRRLSSSSGGVDTKMRFTIEPHPGDSGFSQWHDAMRMVVRLPGGVPNEFRKKLWLTLSERHVQARKINWSLTSKFCFNEKSNPDDDALGEQIVKDLHRTGCSMFSGQDSEHNQALLKQVLLAYARWNKAVGYCQGFNMLAAIILEVMEWNVEDSLKVMIYLIEGLLPESYFANNLRGLSVDMAVFRDLLRIRLPSLSKHLDRLQHQDSSSGVASYEPPLINVFTMQWFLTLFSNCLPKSAVLRIWDLIFLEGNEVLLRTALAIWDCLTDRIMSVESADEFYSIMGVLTREMMEFGVTDTNELVKTICIMAPFPFPQLNELREKYTFNIRPLTSSFVLVRKGLQLFHSDDEEDCEVPDDQIMVANWCLSTAFNGKNRAEGTSGSRTPSPSSSSPSLGMNVGVAGLSSSVSANFLSANNIDSQRMTLDISLLKKQYAKLKERQKQAHVILTEGFQYAHTSAFCKRQPVAVNHLLLGKTALTTKRPKRPSPVVMQPMREKSNNNINNRNNSPKTMLSNRSKTVLDFSPTIKSSLKSRLMSTGPVCPVPGIGARRSGVPLKEKGGETISWNQVRLERKRQRFTRKLSAPSLSVCKEVSHEEKVESLEEVDFIAEKSPTRPTFPSNQSSSDSDTPTKPRPRPRSRSRSSSSSSSSSTELCDDLHEEATDYTSSPEIGRRVLSKLQNGDICSGPKESPNDARTGTPKETPSDTLTNGANDGSAKRCLSPVGPAAEPPAELLSHDLELLRSSPDSSSPSNLDYNSAVDSLPDADDEDEKIVSEIKRELSNLSVEECIQRLNEKMSTLAD